MKKLGGEQQSTPTDPNERDNHLTIPGVSPELIPYLTAKFDEGYEAIVQENPEWLIDHYIEEDIVEVDGKEVIKKLEIISLYSFRQNINYQAVAEEEHKDTRAVRIIKRENETVTITVLDILTEIDDTWTTLSWDQNPSDLQP